MRKTFNATIIIRLFLINFVIFSSSSALGQSLCELNFDISKVPFSRYGSYMALSTMNQDASAKKQLRLYELTGKDRWSNTIFTIDPVVNGKVIPVEYEVTPLQITGKTTIGNLVSYFETPEILHIVSNGPGVSMSGRTEKSNMIKLPGTDNTWKLITESFVVTVKSGLVSIEDSKLIVNPDGGHLEIILEQFMGDWLPKTYKETYQQSISKLEKELLQWEKNTPSVGPQYLEAKNLASYINWSCIVSPRGNIKRYGMVMSNNWMNNIWSWDNCFNAIGLSYHDPKLSWDQIMVVFDQQNELGALPDYINAHHIVWEFRKPPIQGWALAKILKQYKLNQSQLVSIYDKLSKWTNYWFICRDGNKNGLPEYYHGNDSGWDNSTAFDVGYPIESADLAALLVKQMDMLAELAEKLGKNTEATAWRKRSDTLLSAIIKELWTGEQFVSKNVATGNINNESQSLISYIPLLLGNKLPPEISKKMISDLKIAGSFQTAYGLASESPQSKLYNPDGYWRGPIWAPTTLMIIDGLMNLNEKEFAQDLAEQFCQTCKKSGFAENFDALSGKPLKDPAYTWTSSVFLILAHDFYN